MRSTLDRRVIPERELPEVALSAHAEFRLVRDAGTFVRVAVTTPQGAVDVDVIVEGVERFNPECPVIDEIVLEPLEDLRASKLTCILSRSEPRDLVDLLFLGSAGFPVEDDLDNALKKDAGIDPGVLAWLLRQYPVEPLPQMLQAGANSTRPPGRTSALVHRSTPASPKPRS